MTSTEHASNTRFLRVVPVLFVLLLVAIVALAVSPGLRHQVTQSFARQQQHYLELYFTDEVAARECPVVDGAVQVQAAVRSHLAADDTFDWTATMGTADTGGRLDTRPGAESRFTVRLAGLASPATLTVRLVGRGEHLTLHCD